MFVHHHTKISRIILEIFSYFFGISNKIHMEGGDKNEKQRRDDLQCKKHTRTKTKIGNIKKGVLYN